jgi:hypothetical protein
MARLRHALARIAVALLLCQASTLALVPAILWTDSGEALMECTCTHGGHAICPMHHKRVPNSQLCLLQNAEDSGTAILGSLFGTAGLMPTLAQAAVPEPRLAVALFDTSAPTLRPAPPDPPPPRA